MRRPRRTRKEELNNAKRYCQLQTRHCLLLPTREETTLAPPLSAEFRASYHIRKTDPYENMSIKRNTGCMVRGRSMDAIKDESANWYMKRSAPSHEHKYVTKLRREEYVTGFNAGSFLFLPPAVSQASACDGIRITISAVGQEAARGTLPIY